MLGKDKENGKKQNKENRKNAQKNDFFGVGGNRVDFSKIFLEKSQTLFVFGWKEKKGIFVNTICFGKIVIPMFLLNKSLQK